MKPRRPIDPHANPMLRAMQKAALLTPQRRAELLSPRQTAVDELRQGRGSVAAWKDLADAFNVAEALCELHIAGNLLGKVEAAQEALGALLDRYKAGRGWTLHAAELEALREGLWLYGVQLEHCSAGEHERAVQIVRRRIAGALAGNAGPRATVHQVPDETVGAT